MSRWVVALVLLAAAADAGAQTLSPGKLARAHQELEGLSNCTQCHEFGSKELGPRCLECHKPLKRRVDAHAGMHGRLPAGRSCLDCHRDHRGLGASLTEWGGPRDRFDHELTGWGLTGKHATAKCNDCHEPRLVEAAELRKRFGSANTGTYLGLKHACAACHFDEHRGQLKTDCSKCHDARRFSSTPGFRHSRVFRLRGAHRHTQCSKCHPRASDPQTHPAFPPPAKASSFVRYVPTAKRCADCHKDPHDGKLGLDCQKCHSEKSWHATRTGQAAPTFHDQSRFPLEGKHRDVSCEKCHPAKPRGGMVLRGFPFENCSDCHVDAHLGQLVKPPDTLSHCERCHDEEGFYPNNYPLINHDLTRYPLRGAHQAVACNACHTQDREGLGGQPKPDGRQVQQVVFTRLVWPGKDFSRCESCHQDPHQGQFSDGDRPLECARCHQVKSFQELVFDHDADSSFPLRGRHQKVSCTRCHGAATPKGQMAWRGTPTACGACHTDVHQGQFQASPGNGTDCAHCHNEQGFVPSHFVHGDPRFTPFELRGGHAALACRRCHPRQPGRNGAPLASWYRGVPTRCDGCHVDIHAGGPR